MAAKLLGSLVGTPEDALRQTGAGFISNTLKLSPDVVLWRDWAVTKGNLIGDTIQLALLASTALVDQWRSQVIFDAFGAGVTMTIGDATFPTALRTSFSVAAAGQARLNRAPAVVGAPLWQRLGYAADPGGTIEVLAFIAGANPADGKAFGWQFFGRR